MIKDSIGLLMKISQVTHLVPRPVPASESHEVGGVRHGALVEVILLHLEPVTLPRLIGRLGILK